MVTDVEFEFENHWYVATGRLVWEEDPQAAPCPGAPPYIGPRGGWLVEDLIVHTPSPSAALIAAAEAALRATCSP